MAPGSSPRDRDPAAAERNPMIALRGRLEALGSKFIVYDEPTEIAAGVWVTGPVPRAHDEKNYPTGPGSVVVENGDVVPDRIPESQSLVVLAEGGPIFISGCGHAGLINTLEHASAHISDEAPQTAIGGFHLFNATEETLQWTAQKLAAAKLGSFLGSHCTGFEGRAPRSGSRRYEPRNRADRRHRHALRGGYRNRSWQHQPLSSSAAESPDACLRE